MAEPPKVKEFTITPEIEAFGFIKASVVNGYLTLRHKSGGAIRCEFDSRKLPTFKKRLENAINANENGVQFDGDFDSRKFVIKFIDLLVQDAEEEAAQSKTQLQEEQKEKNSIVDEIKQTKELFPELSSNEWSGKLQEKYGKLRGVVQLYMPEIWPGLEFELSILRILDIEGCTLPFIGIILGRPSSYKTVIISLLKKWHSTFYTDNFTARSFVSHSTAVNSPEELEEIDLLPKIRGNLFLTPELSPMFTTKEEDLIQLLGIITRVADGHGYVSDSGAHGHRGYDEDIMFTWAGAAVDIPYKVYKILGNLGAKLYFFRMEFKDETTDQLLNYATVGDEFNDIVLDVQNALFDYLKWFEICPVMTPKIMWDRPNDNRDALKYIVMMADLLSYLRCVAQVWETHDSQGSDYAYSISQREVPRRAVTCLSNLARGHALLTGRNHITLDDVPMIIKTALDTAPIERVSLFSLLIANNGKLTTSEILQSLNVSRPTALRTMAELKAIGLVDVEDFKDEGQNNVSRRIVLKPRFSWFLSDSMIKKIYPHTPPVFSTPGGNGHGRKEDVLWETYVPLEEQQEQDPTNYTQADKKTVGGAQLRERLVSSGHFSEDEAIEIISDMVKAGKLKEVMLDTYRRMN
jgi:DNA-binding transcriptional ArsR family regulator